jgi:hypothetical protein
MSTLMSDPPLFAADRLKRDVIDGRQLYVTFGVSIASPVD